MGLCRALVYVGAAAAVVGDVSGRHRCSPRWRCSHSSPASTYAAWQERLDRAAQPLAARVAARRRCCWRWPALASGRIAAIGHLPRARRRHRLCALPAGEAPDGGRGAARGRRC